MNKVFVINKSGMDHTPALKSKGLLAKLGCRLLNDTRYNRQPTVRLTDYRTQHDPDNINSTYPNEILPKKDSQLKQYEQIQHNVYEFLYQPSGLFSYTYHILVFLLVFMCFVWTILLSIQRFSVISWKFMAFLERVIILWFVFEFVIRLWASGCRPAYQGWRGKVRYLCKIPTIIDIVVIGVSIGLLIAHVYSTAHVIFGAALRGFHRLFLIIGIVLSWGPGADTAFRPFRIILSVLYRQRDPLIIILYFCFIISCVSSYMVYLVESPYNSVFNNIDDGLWWSIVTMFGVGAAIVPITSLGKIVASVFVILFYYLFQLPVDVIGTGLALKVQQIESEVQNKSRILAAAALIQSSWRLYSTNSKSLPIVTWISTKNTAIGDRDQRNAFRFIRILKFLRAKHVFKQTCRKIGEQHPDECSPIEHRQIRNRVKLLRTDLKGLEDRLVICYGQRVLKLMTKLATIDDRNREMSERLTKQSLYLENLLEKKKLKEYSEC